MSAPRVWGACLQACIIWGTGAPLGEQAPINRQQQEIRQRISMGEGEDINGTAKSGLVVVTGVFDLLHIGHLRFLEAARHLGDALIVGVEDDARVRRWKGADRPIMTQDDRCELLAALRVVDRVFLISGERVDPDYYVEVLRPL